MGIGPSTTLTNQKRSTDDVDQSCRGPYAQDIPILNESTEQILALKAVVRRCSLTP
jgi:hypothetical protein